ncbi:dihydroorotate dehydrogenase electron transfer subunit [Clostridium algidicarnis]|uniref:dihydroorotate dehydrogenase electron transfer subunit n=1 Tax=Clostridium algidicarnis TaxID=37659 RepID=UPI000498351A|nr:dihydroorotate dehydrogenase electron transfer subunit [Clostridium algidicarnis]
MSANFTKVKVIKNDEVYNNIFSLCVELNEDAENLLPGKFYMLKLEDTETLLPRPISICSFNSNKLEFLYEVVGKGTKSFSTLSTGEYINIIGPLGNGFPANEAKGKIAVISGGIGIAPMKELIKRLKDSKDVQTIHLYSGFREEPYFMESFKDTADTIYIATDSGKEGYKGFITDIVDYKSYDLVFCCGPLPMMKKVAQSCKECGVKSYISMEGHMACGVGACLVCTCKTKEGNKRTCKDGPIFLGETLEF